MGLPDAVIVQQAGEIVGEIAEIQRPLVIVAVAVAAGVPRDRPEAVSGEGLDLLGPVGSVAADAVHEDEQGAVSGLVDGEIRWAGDFSEL